MLIAPSSALRELTWDGWLLFATRGVRMYCYGLLAVVLLLYLSALGLSEAQSGLLLTLTLAGDTVVSLWLTTRADRLGRRKMLIVGALLMAGAGAAFAMTGNFWLLLAAGTIGVISPGGNEVGPFLSIEQAGLAQIAEDRRTDVFAWYNLLGSFAAALGSLCGGLAAQFFQERGFTGADAYRPAVFAYGAAGLLLALFFSALSSRIEFEPLIGEARPAGPVLFGLHKSRKVVLKLSLLFSLDAFGGGFVLQSIIAYWLHLRFGADPAELGGIFLMANLLAGVSALAAGRLAHRIGLVKTMVLTHLPSNVLLILVPFMPSLEWAVVLLLLRFSISQMDVPTRQAYTMAVVSPDERSAAAGVTTVARSIGAAASPMLAARLLGIPSLMGVPLILAGAIKIVYDLLLWRAFATRKSPPPEKPA